MVENEKCSLGLIVTSYNSSHVCLRFCSWLLQFASYFQRIVIVDDCSDDESFETLVAQLSHIDSVVFSRLDSNTGRPSIPRNTGLTLMSGVDRIVFLDIDDLLTESYLKFLLSTEVGKTQNIYSGVKVPLSGGLFCANYPSDFSISRDITVEELAYKNHVVFSGASIPANLAPEHEFENCPLEDWLFWRAIGSNQNFSGVFYRLLDVPVGYDAGPSLSPAKSKQLARVHKHLSVLGLIRYFLGTMRLKYEEFGIRRRLRRNRSLILVP